MNFGSNDIDLNLAVALKPQHKQEAPKPTHESFEEDLIVDLARVLKEKTAIFEWITEEHANKGPDHAEG